MRLMLIKRWHCTLGLSRSHVTMCSRRNANQRKHKQKGISRESIQRRSARPIYLSEANGMGKMCRAIVTSFI